MLKLFLKLYIVGAIVGTAIQAVQTFLFWEVGEPLVPPYGILFFCVFGALWAVVWLVTPGKWWDFED
jgi:hypothetical protein